MPCDALQLRSAAHRSASSAERSAVLCRALPCCVPCCTFTSSYIPVTFEVSYHVPVLLILYQVCTYYVVVGSQTMHPQLRSARLYIAQQRSAAQGGAVPCPSFCVAVPCGAVRFFEHTAAAVVVAVGMIQVPGSCTCLYSSFCYLRLIVLSRSSCPRPPPQINHTYCRSERDINEHTAQRRAISSARAPLGIIINSLVFAPKNHGRLLPVPFTHFSCILPCASVPDGVSRQGALVPHISAVYCSCVRMSIACP